MKIEIPVVQEEINRDIYVRNIEWVKKALFSYLKGAGYVFPEAFDKEIEVTSSGCTITIIGKPKAEKQPKTFTLWSRITECWSWLKCSVLRVAG